jgi:DNA-binding transcriptional MerR regulator
VTKGPDAFRTISEAADEIGVAQHVLRFWETKFSFIRPMKRAGGRRFYRPHDLLVLRGVRRLLHDEGYTIAGARQLLAQEARELRGTSQLPLIEGGASTVRVKAKLQKVRSELRDLLNVLSAPPARKPRIGANVGRRLFD